MLFSRDWNRSCLVFRNSLRFSGSKFLINLRRQFRACKSFLCTKIFSTQVFRERQPFHFLFKITISKMLNLCSRLHFHYNLLINRLLTSVFVLVNGIIFNRSNGLLIKSLKICNSMFNTLNLFRMDLFGSPDWWGGRGAKRFPLPKICHKYSAMMKLGIVLPYLMKIQKMYKSRDTPLDSCWHQSFFTVNQHIFLARSRNTDIDCISVHNF